MSSLLITAADLADYVRVSANVGALLLEPALRDAHVFDVLPLLRPAEVGNLVAYLVLAEAERGAHPAHELYTTAVRPLLCYETYRRFLLDHGAHITANGVETISDVGHQPVSGQQRTEMRADAQAKCAHYRALLGAALHRYRGAAAPAACGPAAVRRPGRGGLRITAI